MDADAFRAGKKDRVYAHQSVGLFREREAMSPWKKVENETPPRGLEVLVFVKRKRSNHIYISALYEEPYGWIGHNRFRGPVTHWRRLPSGPNGLPTENQALHSLQRALEKVMKQERSPA